MIRRFFHAETSSSPMQMLRSKESRHRRMFLLPTCSSSKNRGDFGAFMIMRFPKFTKANTSNHSILSANSLSQYSYADQSDSIRTFSSFGLLPPKAMGCTNTSDNSKIHSDNSRFIEYDLDFFDEPISFLGEQQLEYGLQAQKIREDEAGSSRSSASDMDAKTQSMLAFNTHMVQMISKGQVSTDGGDEFGISAKAAHSSAITWADLIRHVSLWCQNKHTNLDVGSAKGENNGKLICDAPMLAVAAFAPVLISGGFGYLKNLDRNHFKLQPQNSCCTMIAAAIDRKDDERLSRRESLHLWALYYLFHDEHSKALAVYGKLLESSPGDALALSLALDVSQALGDKGSAFRLVSSVASYWNERGQRSPAGHTAMAGHSIGTALIANGYAVGGYLREAEQLAEKSLSRDASASGIAASALGHVYYAEGRASEGASLFTGHGTEYYETCGFLFFNSYMGALGSRFIMDRSGASADRVALRLYDESFARIIEYSGYHDIHSPGAIVRRVPSTRKRVLMETVSGAASSIFGRLFGSVEATEQNGGRQNSLDDEETDDDDDMFNSIIQESEPRSLEDVLTWLPPTKNLMVDGTLLLFRLTVSGAVHSSDARWENLRTAWKKIIDTDLELSNEQEMGQMSMLYSPLVQIIPYLVLDEAFLDSRKAFLNDTSATDTVSAKIKSAAATMGSLMQIQGKNCHEIESDAKKKWANVVYMLQEARSGWAFDNADSDAPFKQPKIALKPDLLGLDISLGSFIEHAICHAAVQSEGYESLCIARSLCSESVSLRSNSPENWYRYGVILEKLGDEENAADAFHASVSLGSGEGGQLGARR